MLNPPFLLQVSSFAAFLSVLGSILILAYIWAIMILIMKDVSHFWASLVISVVMAVYTYTWFVGFTPFAASNMLQKSGLKASVLALFNPVPLGTGLRSISFASLIVFIYLYLEAKRFKRGGIYWLYKRLKRGSADKEGDK